MTVLFYFQESRAIIQASLRFPFMRKIAALAGPCFINFTTAGSKEKTDFIRMLLKREMLSVDKKATRFGELVNVHPEMRGKALRIPFLKIDKSGLFTTGAAALTLEVIHKGAGWRRVDDVCFSPSAFLLLKFYFESCFSTKSPITGSLYRSPL